MTGPSWTFALSRGRERVDRGEFLALFRLDFKLSGIRCPLCSGRMRVARTQAGRDSILRVRICVGPGCHGRRLTVEMDERATYAPQDQFRARCADALIGIAEKLRDGHFG